MGKRSEYKIKFTGLQDGKHNFHFEVDDAFFEQLDFSIIDGGKLNVDVELEKQPTMLTVAFDIKGFLNVMCDKCSDRFNYNVEGSEELIYKFGEQSMDDEKIKIIGSEETDIDLTLPVYEFTALLLPARTVHPEGKCNERMLQLMNDYLMVEKDEVGSGENIPGDETEEVDPRWEALKKLKNDKNKK